MHSCRTCGSQVARDDDFCGTCGAYLGWESESGADAKSAPRAPDTPTQRIPISEPEQPEAVQPAKPVAPRPESTAPVKENAPDGPPCRSCATPNPPDRRFCRRCAQPLTAVAEPVTVKMRTQRSRNIDRHKLWRRLIILGLLIALVAGTVLLYPLGKTAVQDVLDKTLDAVPISPAEITASAEVPGHPATNLADVRTDKYWGAPAPGAWVDFTFDQPYRLVGMLVHIGPSAKPDAFPKQARPTQLDIIITSADGQTRTVHANLADQPEQPQINIGASDVTQVRIVITGATDLTGKKHIAISLVEFFKRA
jgi:hypothetical protein